MNDLISRHAAIDDKREAIATVPPAEPETCVYWDRESNFCALHRPSAQPEIIRCKDCKRWMREYLDINGKHGCNVMREYTAPNDYCYKAERKDDE